MNVFNGSFEDWSKLSAAEKEACEPLVTISCSCSPTDTICVDTTHSPIDAIVNIDTKDAITYTINPDLLKSYRKIVVSDCPKCASNLPLRETDSKGICKCNYCGKEVYVW